LGLGVTGETREARACPARSRAAVSRSKGDSNSHGARPVHLIITMIKWIRTSRLSTKNSLSLPERPEKHGRVRREVELHRQPEFELPCAIHRQPGLLFLSLALFLLTRCVCPGIFSALKLTDLYLNRKRLTGETREARACPARSRAASTARSRTPALTRACLTGWAVGERA